MAFGTRQLKHLTCHIRLDPRSGRPLRSGCGRGRLLGRNCPVAATGRWRCREGVVAAVADAVVVPCRPDPAVAAHPLVPVRPLGVLLAVAHSEAAETPLPTRTVVLRQVRLVRVWRIRAGNGSRRHNRGSAAQHRNAKAGEHHFHFASLEGSTPLRPAALPSPRCEVPPLFRGAFLGHDWYARPWSVAVAATSPSSMSSEIAAAMCGRTSATTRGITTRGDHRRGAPHRALHPRDWCPGGPVATGTTATATATFGIGARSPAAVWRW